MTNFKFSLCLKVIFHKHTHKELKSFFLLCLLEEEEKKSNLEWKGEENYCFRFSFSKINNQKNTPFFVVVVWNKPKNGVGRSNFWCVCVRARATERERLKQKTFLFYSCSLTNQQQQPSKKNYIFSTCCCCCCFNWI